MGHPCPPSDECAIHYTDMSPRPSLSSLTARGRDGPARTGLCLSEFAFPRDALVHFIHALDAIFELAAVLRELLGHCVHAARYVATERGLDGHNLTDSELMGSHGRPTLTCGC